MTAWVGAEQPLKCISICPRYASDDETATMATLLPAIVLRTQFYSPTMIRVTQLLHVCARVQLSVQEFLLKINKASSYISTLFTHLSTHPSIYPSTCPPVHLSIYLSPIHTSIHLSIYLCFYPPIHPSIYHPPIHQLICPSFHASIHLSIAAQHEPAFSSKNKFNGRRM